MTPLLDKHQAARILRVSIKTLDRLRQQGLLQAVKVRGCVRFHLDDIEQFVRDRRRL